jgi:hypothetical protein
MDSEQFGRAFNSEKAREILDREIEAADRDPEIIEDFARHIRVMTPGALRELQAFLQENRKRFAENVDDWRAELQKRPSISRLLSGTLLGVIIGLPTGVVGSVASAMVVPALDYASEKYIGTKAMRGIEAFMRMAPRLGEAINNRLAELKKQ